jgi:hypothetical protein
VRLPRGRKEVSGDGAAGSASSNSPRTMAGLLVEEWGWSTDSGARRWTRLRVMVVGEAPSGGVFNDGPSGADTKPGTTERCSK